MRIVKKTFGSVLQWFSLTNKNNGYVREELKLKQINLETKKK